MPRVPTSAFEHGLKLENIKSVSHLLRWDGAELTGNGLQILIICFGKDALELDAGTSMTTVVRAAGGMWPCSSLPIFLQIERDAGGEHTVR